MEKYRSWLSEAETRISQVEDTVHTDYRELTILQRQVQALHGKSVDIVNRLRHNNLWVVGLHERAEGAKPTEFAERFLTILLGLTDLPPTFIMKRAHMVPLLCLLELHQGPS